MVIGVGFTIKSKTTSGSLKLPKWLLKSFTDTLQFWEDFPSLDLIFVINSEEPDFLFFFVFCL